MNIFYLDNCPESAAQYMCDKHVHKQIIESAQMLANCYKIETLESAPLTQSGKYRRHSFLHHPCSKWVMSSDLSFRWLLKHAYALLAERFFRWGRPRHFTHDFIDWCGRTPPDNIAASQIINFDGIESMPQPAQAFGKENQHLINKSPVQGYRDYYNQVKRHTIKMTWTRTPIPKFYRENTKCKAQK